MTIEGRPEIQHDWNAEYAKQRKDRMQDAIDDYLQDEHVDARQAYEEILSCVDDVIEYITRSLKKRKHSFGKKIYNICASNPKKIIDLVNIMSSNLNVSPIINFKPKRKGEMLKTFGSNSKLTKEYGKKQFTKFETGIKKTIKFFKKLKY